MHLDRRRFLQLAAGTAAVAASYKFYNYLRPLQQEILRSSPVIKYSPGELSKLKISFHNYKDVTFFFQTRIQALFEGMQKHGLNVFWGNNLEPAESDIAVVTGWLQSKIILDCQRKNKNMLVMEQGYIQPRWDWPSLGFNGLSRYATYPPAPDDNGERFQKYFGYHLMPWQQRQNGYVLLIGQVPYDHSLYGLNMNGWLQETTNQLIAQNIDVVFRPHPRVVAAAKRRRKRFFVPKGARLLSGSLEENLSGAQYSVTYSSTAAVESVLAGIPTVVMCEGSVAWDVTSHDLNSPIITPDRGKWCAELAWKQWNFTELEDGTAWDYTKQAILA